MSSSVDEVEKELRALKAFADANLKRGSFVSDKVEDLIVQATREHAKLLKSNAGAASVFVKGNDSGMNLILLINHPGFKEPRTISVERTTSLAVLKGNIQTITGPTMNAERIKVRRTGKAWGDFDEKTLEQCEIRDKDEIVVDCKLTNENLNPKGVQRLENSGITPKSPFELVVLALHCFLLDEDFVAVVELPNSVPGFAPSLKGLSVHEKTNNVQHLSSQFVLIL